MSLGESNRVTFVIKDHLYSPLFQRLRRKEGIVCSGEGVAYILLCSEIWLQLLVWILKEEEMKFLIFQAGIYFDISSWIFQWNHAMGKK